MADTLTVRITPSGADIRYLHEQFLWTVRLDGRLLVSGRAAAAEEAEEAAMNWVIDRIPAEEVDHLAMLRH